MNINFFNRYKKTFRMKLIKEAKYKRGYSVLRDSKTINEENEFLLELAKEYDEFGYISKKLGRELDNLFVDDSYVVGIHRTGFTPMNDDMINDIFNNGLKNNGHIMQGAKNTSCNLELTVSYLPNLTFLSGQLKAAPKYKNSEGCIIVKIPKSYLGQREGEVKPIYYCDENEVRLLPEFIYGYVPVDKNYNVGNIIRNPNYCDIHDYNNEGLVYDISVSKPCKRI